MVPSHDESLLDRILMDLPVIGVPNHSYAPCHQLAPRTRAPALPKAQKPNKNPPSAKAKGCPKAKVSPKAAGKAKATAAKRMAKKSED